MIPICARCMPLSRAGIRDPGSGIRDPLGIWGWDLGYGIFLNHPLNESRPVLLANVAGAHGRIVVEEDQVLTVDRLAQEPLLERERFHRIQIEGGYPVVLDVRLGRDDIRGEDRGLPAGLEVDHLVVRRVAARASDTHARSNLAIVVEEIDAPGLLER